MKRKKLFAQLALLIMCFVLVFSAVACRSGGTPETEPPAQGETEPEVKPYKIGIMTGTVSQGEEEYQEAINQIAKYGDTIVHATYPDNFSTETETTISQVVQMASDPDVKAIVFVQAVPGAAAAIEKVRETRPDILFVAGVPAEDPPIIVGWCRKSGHKLRGKIAILSRTGVRNGRQTEKTLHRRVQTGSC